MICEIKKNLCHLQDIEFFHFFQNFVFYYIFRLEKDNLAQGVSFTRGKYGVHLPSFGECICCLKRVMIFQNIAVLAFFGSFCDRRFMSISSGRKCFKKFPITT